MAHDVAEADDSNQAARVRIILAANDDETVNTADLDQREDGPKGVLRVASNDALEVGGTLLQSLLDREVQRLVGSKTNQCLALV